MKRLKIPVIATRAGALPEVVGEDGKTGILVPPAKSGVLAVAIKRLLEDKTRGKEVSDDQVMVWNPPLLN